VELHAADSVPTDITGHDGQPAAWRSAEVCTRPGMIVRGELTARHGGRSAQLYKKLLSGPAVVVSAGRSGIPFLWHESPKQFWPRDEDIPGEPRAWRAGRKKKRLGARLFLLPGAIRSESCPSPDNFLMQHTAGIALGYVNHLREQPNALCFDRRGATAESSSDLLQGGGSQREM